MTHKQHIPIIDGFVNGHEGQFQVNIPNEGALPRIPDDVAVEVPDVVNEKGIQPLRVPPLPKKILLECLYPDWLQMERALEALLTGDKSMMLFGVLQSHQTRSCDHGVKTLEALFDTPIEPNEPMSYVKDIKGHFSWPKNW